MTPEDAFWATRILLRFNEDAIRTLVKTGMYDDPGAVDYLTHTLMERQDKIIRYYLSLLPPLDEFQVAADSLQFKNLGVKRQIGTVQGYSYQWFRFDNHSETPQSIGSSATTSNTSIPVPSENAEYLMVRIENIDPSLPGWKKNINVYLRTSDRTVVGIERD
jgi:hypothetical protein